MFRNRLYGGLSQDHHRYDRRWPVWASLLFILIVSLVLWALILAGILWLMT